MRKNNWKDYLVLIVFTIIFAYPLYIMFQKSMISGGFSNYVSIAMDKSIPRYLLNSTIVTASTIILTFLTASLSAYAFSFFSFKGNKTLFMVFLFGLMVAPCSIVVPLFVLVKKLNLLNNYLGLIGPYVALSFPFAMLILKNYYDDLPRSLVESARIDGCKSFKIYVKIVLPLTRPVMAVSIIMTALTTWNEFLIAMLIMMKQNKQMITIAPINYMGQYQTNIGKLFSILILIALPPMIVFFVMQKEFVKGITAGSIKG